MPEKTLIWRTADFLPDNERAYAAVSRVLSLGGVIAFPTDTFYGLGALAFSGKGIKRVYRLKRRDEGKPLSVVISDMRMARDISSSLPPLFITLGREFWPGPLTLIVKTRPIFPEQMLGPGGTLGMRIPDVSWLRNLVRRLGAPLTATSANISGEGEISEPEKIIKAFRGKVDGIIDGGRTPGGWPSTVVDLSSKIPRVLRDGGVPASLVAKYLAWPFGV
jgi:L-threonylcarbamoyladenylate synthase